MSGIYGHCYPILTFNFKNMKIYSKLSEPIDPKKFITFEEFYSHITKLWIEYLTELRKYNYLKQN